MNLSAHNLSPNPSRYPTTKSSVAPGPVAPNNGQKEEFAELFAGVAQRRETGGNDSKAARPNVRDAGAHRPSSSKPRSRTSDEAEKRSKEKTSPEGAVTDPQNQLNQTVSNPGKVEKEKSAAGEGKELDPCGTPAGGAKDAAEVQAGQTEEISEIEKAADAKAVTNENVEGGRPLEVAADKPEQDLSVASGFDIPGMTSLTKSKAKIEATAASMLPRSLPGKAPSAKSSSAAAADFAESGTDGLKARGDGKLSDTINFLAIEGKEVVERNEVLGINVAKPEAEMSSLPLSSETKALFSTHVEVREVGSSSDFSAQSASAPAENPLLTDAHVAVQAAMEASEKFTTESQRAVNLRFSTGGGDLSVRVEMHDGQVRATFRTDSVELRSALAHEWQSLTTANGERAQRFADPVFASSSFTASTGGGGENLGQQRGQELRQSSERFEFSGGLRSAAKVADSTDVSSVPLRPVMPLTALRLHTFA